MKVKRAAQIFSNTVQDAMMTYICSGHLPQEAYHTADFVKNMDALFDIFNSTGLHDVKLYKRAFQENSPSFEYLYMMTDIFKRVKIQGSRGATHCITGWQLSISAVMAASSVVPKTSLMSWVPLNLQPLTSIRYPNKMLCFMLEGIFARHNLRNTVAKSVIPHWHGLN